MNKKNIVIIGGGFGGTSAAKVLIKNKEITDKYNVILINKTDYLLFTPTLYQLATHEKNEMEITVKLKNIFKNTLIQLIFKEVKYIDHENKLIFINDNYTISYEYLIIAVGSSINDYGIEGIRKYAHFLKTADDAEKINNDLEELLQRCKNAEKINIVIGGSGYTGIEIGSEIADYSYSLIEKFNIDKSSLNILLINPSDKMLKNMDSEAGIVAKNKLQELGVKIVENEKVTNIDDKKIFLSDGKILDYDMFIWTGGVKGNETIAKSRFAKQDYMSNDRLIIDRFLRVKDCSNIYSCGDASSYEDENLPMMAQIAIDEGKIAAKNIIATIQNKKLRKYKLHIQGQFVPISDKYSYGVVFGHAIKGRIAIYLEKLIYLKFLMSVLPPFKAIRKWLKYLFD